MSKTKKIEETKFVVDSGNLHKQLKLISKIVVNNPVIPILENFLFEIEPNSIKITASDIVTYGTVELFAQSEINCKIAIPCKILMDTLKKLPDQPIEFKFALDVLNVEITSESGQYTIACEDASDFPKAPEFIDHDYIEINNDVFSSVIDKTIFAVSNDELRPAMTGVNFVGANGSMQFVTTDGHILVKCNRFDIESKNDFTFIVPSKPINIFKTVLSSVGFDPQISYDERNFYFVCDNVHIVSRLIDERYPDYNNVIPSSNENTVIVIASELLSAINRIGAYTSNITSQIVIGFHENELQLSAEDLDYGNKAKESVVCEYKGEEIQIGFNHKLLAGLLKEQSSHSVRITFSAPNRAVLILPVDESDEERLLNLIMPVMINHI